MSESPKAPIRAALNGAIYEIVIDRNERANMLTLDMVATLGGMLGRVPGEAKAVHLTSTGEDFSLGRDPQGNPETSNALDLREALIEPILSLYDAMAACPVPLVCSLRGRAYGLAAALATASDVTIAADTARFRLPEMEKNLPPTLAMSAMMRRASHKGLAWLVLSMREIDARRALEMGLVSEIVPERELEGVVGTFLADLSTRSRPALAAVKDYLRVSSELGPRGARDVAANILATVLSSGYRP